MRGDKLSVYNPTKGFPDLGLSDESILRAVESQKGVDSVQSILAHAFQPQEMILNGLQASIKLAKWCNVICFRARRALTMC